MVTLAATNAAAGQLFFFSIVSAGLREGREGERDGLSGVDLVGGTPTQVWHTRRRFEQHAFISVHLKIAKGCGHKGRAYKVHSLIRRFKKETAFVAVIAVWRNWYHHLGLSKFRRKWQPWIRCRCLRTRWSGQTTPTSSTLSGTSSTPRPRHGWSPIGALSASILPAFTCLSCSPGSKSWQRDRGSKCAEPWSAGTSSWPCSASWGPAGPFPSFYTCYLPTAFTIQSAFLGESKTLNCLFIQTTIAFDKRFPIE